MVYHKKKMTAAEGQLAVCKSLSEIELRRIYCNILYASSSKRIVKGETCALSLQDGAVSLLIRLEEVTEFSIACLRAAALKIGILSAVLL